MRLRVLGCSGGIGPGLKTTALLLDRDLLLDAGSGLADLTPDEMARVRHVFITHAHLDHIAFLPLLLDHVFDQITEPIIIHGLPETLLALRQHVFNSVVWPDFSVLPSPDQPAIRYAPMAVGETIELGGRVIDLLPAAHILPTAGYRVEHAGKALAFSGDTTENDALWKALNDHRRLDTLLVEVSYPNARMEMCRIAKHYCPALLARDLTKLRHAAHVYVTHQKPGEEEVILRECRAAISTHRIEPLMHGQVLDF